MQAYGLQGDSVWGKPSCPVASSPHPTASHDMSRDAAAAARKLQTYSAAQIMRPVLKGSEARLEACTGRRWTRAGGPAPWRRS